LGGNTEEENYRTEAMIIRREIKVRENEGERKWLVKKKS